jgi:hypothetical protein
VTDVPGLDRASSWDEGAVSARAARVRDPFPRATLRDLVLRAMRSSDGLAIRPADLAGVRRVLTSAELGIWSAQSAYDRAHTIRVARRVERRLAGSPWAADPRWPAAGLMHDVGKLSARLSFGERVAANLFRRAIGMDRARAWASAASGLRRRIGVYLAHGEVGAALIRRHGGREETAAWAEAHQTHSGGPAPGIPAEVASALIAADRA